MTSRILTAVLLAVPLAACASRAASDAAPGVPAQTHARPKLIVQLVVDQFRADYVPRYRAQWTKGLHRLLDEGAHFTEARYPYAGTITCAGHASIATGAVPSVHGMVLNEWWDREMRQRIHCPNDPLVTPIGFTKTATARYSGRRMMSQTFADRLDASQPPGAGRVVTMSLKPRSAIGLAGHGGDAVVWFEEGTFATSSAFGQPAWLAEWLRAHPVEASVAGEWTRARAAADYVGTDDDAAARPPQGWTARFPHKLSDTGKPDNVFYDRWQRSPFSDAYLADMAIASIDAMSLGRGQGTDYLGVSFSGLDLVGHKFGPSSHEVQDMLIGVDAQIGRLLAHLDATVGAGNYVVALSSDHGVGEIPETPGWKGGRLVRGTTARVIEDVLDKAWGADTKHVEHDLYTDFYLTEATRARLASDESAVAALRKAVEADPAVLRMMTAQDFERAASSSDPMLAAALLSYYPERSGDISLLLREHYTSSTDATSHGTYYDYDRRVPVILFGSPFKAGSFEGPASPLDIAATWSRLTGVALDRPHGRSLDAAVK